MEGGRLYRGHPPFCAVATMSTYQDLPSLTRIAEILGGDAYSFDVSAPGPGHSKDDRSMSVRPVEGAPDGFVVHSFAGDDPLDCKRYVAEKLGLRLNSSGEGSRKKTTEARAEYVYRTETGEPYLRVQRFVDASGKKQFPQSHWDGEKWLKGKPAGPKSPYRLPELIKAPLTILVYFVEGEKSADCLAKLGSLQPVSVRGRKLPGLPRSQNGSRIGT
jgi:hypothetical protein